jgi:HK97 family phage prohead protease
MERKMFTAVELKLRDDSEYPNGVIEAYVSTFANWDSVGERPRKGAFSKHLDAFLKDGFVALGHDWSGLPIATPIDAYEDDIGLFGRAAFHSTPDAQNVRTVIKERMARGKSVKTSIGYEVLEDEMVEGGRVLNDVKLYEWSIVNVPANQSAIVLGAKSGAVSTLGLNEHIEEVVSALDVLAGRVRERHDFRTKEGRVLSSANRTRIEDLLPSLMSVHDALKDLLNATAPKASEDEVKQAFMQWLHLDAQLNGVK